MENLYKKQIRKSLKELFINLKKQYPDGRWGTEDFMWHINNKFCLFSLLYMHSKNIFKTHPSYLIDPKKWKKILKGVKRLDEDCCEYMHKEMTDNKFYTQLKKAYKGAMIDVSTNE